MDQKKQKPTVDKSRNCNLFYSEGPGTTRFMLLSNVSGEVAAEHIDVFDHYRACWEIEYVGEQSEWSGPETRDFEDEDGECVNCGAFYNRQAGCGCGRGKSEDPVVVYRVRLVDLNVDVMKPEDAVLEIAGFTSSKEYPSVMDIAAALASDKVFRSRQSVYAMNIDEGLGAALIPVDLVLDAFTTRIMDFLMNPAKKGGRA